MPHPLADLSKEDLVQRYYATAIKLKQKPVYVLSVNSPRDFTVIAPMGWGDVQDYAFGNYKQIREKFSVEDICLERPRPQWFLITNPKGDRQLPFYFYYSTNRQFHRGLCSKNTSVESVTKEGHQYLQSPWLDYMLLPALYEIPTPTDKISLGVMENVVKGAGTVIARGQLLFVCEAGKLVVYYRTKQIATFYKDGDYTVDKLFEQEIEECFIGHSSKKVLKELVGDLLPKDERPFEEVAKPKNPFRLERAQLQPPAPVDGEQLIDAMFFNHVADAAVQIVREDF